MPTRSIVVEAVQFRRKAGVGAETQLEYYCIEAI